jgi:hypothetical protein
MAAITITGTLTKVDAKQMTDPDYLGLRKYSPSTERYLHRLNCCLVADDGKRYFFDSPSVEQTVTTAGVAVVLFWVEGEASNWWEKIEGSGVATQGHANKNGIKPLVKVGDRITIRASIKAEKPTYTSVNRVKMAKAATAK